MADVLETKDPWASLRSATAARVGIGRIGDTMPLQMVLDLQQAHAMARDAVYAALDLPAVEAALAPFSTLRVMSRAPDRSTYLRRPDLGRRLSPESIPALSAVAPGIDLLFVVADGLSARAVQLRAAPLIHACVAKLGDTAVGPVVLATQARVALADDIGQQLKAKLVAILIGERPGLSVADSLGVYLTFMPRLGKHDSERNCISNIHHKGGLSCARAAHELVWLIHEALRLNLTGVRLKADNLFSLNVRGR